MDFGHGFTLHRDLGRTGAGDFLPFEALVAIHMVHRWFAFAAAALLFALAWRLASMPASRRAALAVAALTALQIVTGLSNVVLGWPIVAALVHVAGAAALVGVLSTLLVRARRAGTGS
jgi:cytochrome c oxidase assembly protein subunit 15